MSRKKRANQKTKYKNATQKNKGITLIALVITIIVLLILASITYIGIAGEERSNNKDSRSTV